MQLMRSFISLVSPNALFFFASGFLFVKSSQKYTLCEFIVNKTWRLLLPMVVFGAFSIMIKFFASSFVNNPIKNIYIAFLSIFIGKYYWFLYALFFMFVRHKCLKDKSRFIATIIMGGGSLLIVSENDMNIIDKTLYYNVFFYLGSIIGVLPQYQEISNLIRKHKVVALIVACLIMGIGSYIVKINQPSNIYMLHYIFPLISISCIWFSAISLEDAKVLSYFGKYSLQYYLNHLLIIVISFYIAAFAYKYISSYSLCYMIIIVTTITISACMLYIEKNMKKCYRLFGL